MARESRICHPPGATFVMAHRWICRRFGWSAALVVGQIDFLDRAQESSGRPVATRARLLADLEGFVGQRSIDDALNFLVKEGWLKRHERREIGTRNLTTTMEFSLDAEAINAAAGETRETQSPGLQKCKVGNCKSASENAKRSKEERKKTTTVAGEEVVVDESILPVLHAALVDDARQKNKSDPVGWADSAIRRIRREKKLEPAETKLLELQKKRKSIHYVIAPPPALDEKFVKAGAEKFNLKQFLSN